MKKSATPFKIILLMLTVIILAGACKTKERATETTAIREEPSFLVCDVMVSFISIGEGIDGNALKSFERMTDEFMTSHRCRIYKEVYAAGREGEQDYCISLIDIGPELSKEYIEKVENLASDNKLVFVKRDAANKHLD